MFYAVVEISIPFPLIAAGEQHVSSSLAAILIAAVPLIIAVLAIRFDPEERVRGARLIGLLMGFTGVIALVGIDVAGRSDELLGAIFILIAAVGYACGPMTLNRKMSDIEPVAMMGASLAVAAVVLTPFAFADVPDATPSAEALASIVVLGLLCTAAAFVLFGGLLLEVGPGRAAVITYVAPVVAVGLGVAVLGERPGVGAAAGLLLILAGSWLSTDGRLPPGMGAWVARVRARRRGAAHPHQPAHKLPNASWVRRRASTRTCAPTPSWRRSGRSGARASAPPGRGQPIQTKRQDRRQLPGDASGRVADPPAREAHDPQVGRLQVGVELVVVLEGGRRAVGRERVDLHAQARLGPVQVQLLAGHHHVRLGRRQLGAADQREHPPLVARAGQRGIARRGRSAGSPGRWP